MMLICYIYFLVMFSLAVSNFLYPPNWKDVCEVLDTDSDGQKYVNISCYLSGDDQVHLELQQLDTYTRSQSENASYSVTIQCSPDGNLTMAWPMKIERLVNLNVVGCTILEHYKDWNNSVLDSTGDTLQYLSLIDCNILLDPLILLHSLQNVGNTSREWTCHHDTTLKKMVYRNKTISFLIPKDLSTTKSLISLDQVNVVNELLDNKPICEYKNLEVLEETYVRTLSSYHFVLLEEKAEFPRLKFINYSHVGLREIPDVLRDWRLRFRHLEHLDLSYNIISEVRLKNGFDVTSENDTIIDVSNNNITNLSIKDLTEWADLAGMFINISNNPLNCGCLKQDFVSEIQKEGYFEGKLSKYEYIREMTCSSPESAMGKELKSLTRVDMGCEVPPADLTVPLIVVAVVAVSNIICIIIIVKYRKEIKILLYTRFGILFPWDVDDKKELKQYDAFVSYSSEDEDWVYDNLQVNLEQPKTDNAAAFKLCLHQRDFIGGISILDNIIDSIENSRHSIVILSHNFISSMWGMEEFRQAYYQSIVKKHRHLIIVKYGTVSEEELDPMLKRCLKTFTYLDANDKMFLDRLRFALAVKTRPSKSAPNNFARQISNAKSDLESTTNVDSSGSTIVSQISRQSDDSGCELDSIDRSSVVCDISDNDNIPYEHIV